MQGRELSFHLPGPGSPQQHLPLGQGPGSGLRRAAAAPAQPQGLSAAGRQALLRSALLLAGASAQHSQAAHGSRFTVDLCSGSPPPQKPLHSPARKVFSPKKLLHSSTRNSDSKINKSQGNRYTIQLSTKGSRSFQKRKEGKSLVSNTIF